MKKEITITREQFFEFVKKDGETANQISKSTQHYLAYFDNHMATGKKIGWNWAVLIPVWLLYRRMYLWAFIFAFAPGGLSKIINRCIGLDHWSFISLGLSINLLVLLFLFMFADYFYLDYAKKKISKGIVSRGVSLVPVIILAVLWIVSVSVMSFLL